MAFHAFLGCETCRPPLKTTQRGLAVGRLELGKLLKASGTGRDLRSLSFLDVRIYESEATPPPPQKKIQGNIMSNPCNKFFYTNYIYPPNPSSSTSAAERFFSNRQGATEPKSSICLSSVQRVAQSHGRRPEGAKSRLSFASANEEWFCLGIFEREGKQRHYTMHSRYGRLQLCDIQPLVSLLIGLLFISNSTVL